MKLFEITRFEEPEEIKYLSYNYSGNNVDSILDLKDFRGSKVRDFSVSNNNLTDLVGAPVECNEFNASSNKLTTLEGSPRIIHGFYSVRQNKLTNLKGIHKLIDQVDEGFNMNLNLITSNILGIFIIKGDWRFINVFKSTSKWGKVMQELNEIKKRTSDVMDAQEELIQMGMKDYAKL